MKKTLILTLAAAALTLTPAASAAHGVVVVRPGPVFVGPGYYGPYWGPGYGAYGYPYANSGEVKIETKVRDPNVFVNGGFAGTTKDARTLHLRPGHKWSDGQPFTTADVQFWWDDIIMNKDEEALQIFVKKFKEEFMNLPFEEVAFPRGVKGLSKYRNRVTIYDKGSPIHVK